MSWFFRLIFRSTVPDDGRISEADINRAIDLVVENTDPRLKMVSGYQRKLRKPVIRCLLYLNRAVDRIPGPIDVNRKAFGSDARVNAIFPSVEAMRDVFSLSDVVRDFVGSHPDSEVIYCTLGMYRQEKNVLGMDIVNGVLRRGVAQVAVNYGGHWIGVASGDPGEIRELGRWRGMHSLSISALEHVAALRATTRELREQKTLLEARLREIRSAGEGLERAPRPDSGEPSDSGTIRQRLQENARQLEAAQTSLATLDGYLNEVGRVLSHPSRYLGVRPHSVSVTRMGVRAKAGEPAGSKVVTAHIHRPRQPSFDMVLARFPRDELKDPETYRKRAMAFVHSMSPGR
jgi:hypothetical protein